MLVYVEDVPVGCGLTGRLGSNPEFKRNWDEVHKLFLWMQFLKIHYKKKSLVMDRKLSQKGKKKVIKIICDSFQCYTS